MCARACVCVSLCVSILVPRCLTIEVAPSASIDTSIFLVMQLQSINLPCFLAFELQESAFTLPFFFLKVSEHEVASDTTQPVLFSFV